MAMLRRSVGAVWLGVLLGAGAMAGAQPQASPFVAPQSATPVKAEAFSSPEVAAAALIAAARADNVAVMHTILGPRAWRSSIPEIPSPTQRRGGNSSQPTMPTMRSRATRAAA